MQGSNSKPQSEVTILGIKGLGFVRELGRRLVGQLGRLAALRAAPGTIFAPGSSEVQRFASLFGTVNKRDSLSQLLADVRAHR